MCKTNKLVKILNNRLTFVPYLKAPFMVKHAEYISIFPDIFCDMKIF